MKTFIQIAHSTRKSTARRLSAIALGLTLATTVAACGEEEKDDTPNASATQTTNQSSVEVSDAWVRATAGAKDTTMSAAFMVIDNTGDTDVTLTGARTEVAGRAEIHEMVMVDGKSVMQQVEDGLQVRAGSAQLLQSGGNHVMLMDMQTELAPGDEVALTLEFSDGSTVAVDAPVKAFTEEEGHYHAPGTAEHSH
ncbi:copper chaperone PCu(A)C [Nocardioides yefusunii]|uniref:Copper chaperone PCu(A)C n=1 Tax=Nocardioides yefusunii TaxID=2500546 RepID=A0ABW1QY05_9ACTN|nr:copper chaperone PCu(A)C [Nocardioides yefusunii]